MHGTHCGEAFPEGVGGELRNKTPPATHKAKPEENAKEEKADNYRAEKSRQMSCHTGREMIN